MNRELVNQYAYERRRDRVAEQIFPFLKSLVVEGRLRPATYDRDAVHLICDAIRSQHFMDIVEKDDILNYDMKMEISHLVTGLNKSWPAVRRLIYSAESEDFASMVMAGLERTVVIAEACGLRYTEPLALPAGDEDGDRTEQDG